MVPGYWRMQLLHSNTVELLGTMSLKPDMITGSNLRFPANLRCCKGIDDMHGNRATVRYCEPFFHDAARIIRTVRYLELI